MGRWDGAAEAREDGEADADAEKEEDEEKEEEEEDVECRISQSECEKFTGNFSRK